MQCLMVQDVQHVHWSHKLGDTGIGKAFFFCSSSKFSSELSHHAVHTLNAQLH